MKLSFTLKSIPLANFGELTLECTVIPPCRGSRDSLGVPLEPDEPANYEDVVIKTETGEVYLEDIAFAFSLEPDEEAAVLRDIDEQIWDHYQVELYERDIERYESERYDR